MLLNEALRILNQPAGDRSIDVHLLCGFTPLHLETFMRAHLRLRFPKCAVRLHTGLFGDLEGNLRRAPAAKASGALVVVEWSDLDPRLSFRSSAGWKSSVIEDVPRQVEESCQRIEAHLSTLCAEMPVAVVAPTLQIPPLTHLPAARNSPLELRLQTIQARLFERLAGRRGLSVLNEATLSVRSPHAGRYDSHLDLRAGHPYTLAHADAIAAIGVSCLFPLPPKKGLITDLDETLWRGILGDDGVESISWDLQNHSQEHALYQQLLASLAESGFMVAIVSKNDPELVRIALARPDLLLSPQQVFPVEANWGPKSESVGRVLRAWNVSADSVVYVDDSPLELAEVADSHPQLDCLRFPTRNPAAVVALLGQLRERFGKSDVTKEDRLRLDSLRAAASVSDGLAGNTPEDFLKRLQAKITFDVSRSASYGRALELVNKTNQFNLNGQRYTEAEWSSYFSCPGGFLLTVSYEDRFGPLGRIAVVLGRTEGKRCKVDAWVMSCRAFSRRIEFQILRWLYRYCNLTSVVFAFMPTARNGPLQDCFRTFFPEGLQAGDIDLPISLFEKLCPPLFHEVNKTEDGTATVERFRA